MFPLPPGAKLVDQPPAAGMKLPDGAKLVSGGAAPPAERTFMDSVANAGEKFWDWTGKPVAYALGLSGGTDAERGARARDAQKSIVQGIMNEPARVRTELTNALDAFTAGNPRATLHHVLNAIPGVGAGTDVVAQEANKGDFSSAIGHLGALAAPAIARELPTIAPAIAKGAGAMADAGGEVLGSLVPDSVKAVAGALKGSAADVATNPLTRELIGVVSPRARNAMAAADRLKKAYDSVRAATDQPAPEAAGPPAPAPSAAAAPAANPILDQIAQKSGFESYEKSPPEFQTAFRNMAEQPPVPQAPPIQQAAPQPQQAPLQQAPPSATAGKTIAQILQDELAAKRAAVVGTDVPPAPTEAPVAVEAPPQAAEPTVPTPRSLAQTEAAMVQKKPALTDPTEVQSQYNLNGERKSGAQRGEEKHSAAAQKLAADKFAPHFDELGVDPAKVAGGTATEAELAAGAPKKWGNYVQDLGLKNQPSVTHTIPRIIDEYQKLQKAKPKASSASIAQQLKDAMEESGTISKN